LKNENFKIDYCDPYVINHDFNIKGRKKFIKSIANNFSLFKNYDAFILCADHNIFDYKKLIKLEKVIFDLRGRYHKKSFAKKNVISL
tara:strand:+ start:299 stop:559 length:261 start_codon:yes stop_codon:yes gene_type:complete